MGSVLTDTKFISIIMVIATTLMIGTLFYNQVEGMNPIDAFYFSAMTLTTVGYGDIVPQTDAGKLFAVAYTFIGFGVLFAMFKIVADHSLIFGNVKKILDNIGRKREIKKEIDREMKKQVKKEVQKKLRKI